MFEDILESYHMVSRLHGCNTFTDGLDDSGTFVSENDGKGTLGVLSRQGVCI